MKSHALTTDGRPIADVEKALRRYLPGLDVRLEAYSPRQAILPGHLMLALSIDYPPAGDLLRRLGVTRALPLEDEEVLTLLRTRDLADLAPRPAPRVPSPTAVDWHLALCRVDAAWRQLQGPDTIDWTGISVGQIDTGYTAHPAFGFPAPWLTTQLAETFVPDPPAEGPTFPVPEPGKGIDPLVGMNGGHGTRIGATIAGHAASDKFFGVAPKVPLVPVRICDAVLITDRQRQFETAVRHLVDTAQVKVINVSLGALPPGAVVKEMKRAVDHAYAQGVIMVCAAGNHIRSVVAPARLRRTLAVGGITAADVPWSGSSHGPSVDLSAPAADLRRAMPFGDGSFGYTRGGDGTSYATAMVSGAAALWLAKHRAALPATYGEPWQIVEAFRAVVRSTARRPAGWQDGAFGVGVLDAQALLEAPLPDPATLNEEAPEA